MRPVSPMTFSVLEMICNALGMPCFIDNICGQPYANLSVICSLMVALGVKEKSAFKKIREIAGELPEGVNVLPFPFNKKTFRRKMRKLFFPAGKKKNKLNRKEKREFKERMIEIAYKLTDEIRRIPDNNPLYDFWKTIITEFLSNALGAIMKGANIFPLDGAKGIDTQIRDKNIIQKIKYKGLHTI